MIAVSLPYPPSANRLWRAVKGRNIKSAAYREWEGRALVAIAQQRPGHIDGPYSIHIEATRPDRRRRDLGNLEKPLSDALVSAGVVRDDCEAVRILVEWAPGEPSKDAVVHIEIHGQKS
ncbi:RusA family crossover junction endodeoxyribonuclease [Caulobacter sp. UC70_42]|uniref:RusA family crossover junction endodeoxyribonuclease n=1 Tax=Caulobacter sp. UC70_42 TaxID=3374551 RepID=UPI0037569E6B